MANGPAVESIARLTTIWAAATPPPRFSTDVKRVGVRSCNLLDAASWQEMKVRHPGLYSPSCCATVSRMGSEQHQPRFLRKSRDFRLEARKDHFADAHAPHPG